jgi:hypothetical protein
MVLCGKRSGNRKKGTILTFPIQNSKNLGIFFAESGIMVAYLDIKGKTAEVVV